MHINTMTFTLARLILSLNDENLNNFPIASLFFSLLSDYECALTFTSKQLSLKNDFLLAFKQKRKTKTNYRKNC